jgi:hypothetical protein
MFLLSQTIKEENLCTHLVILTENTDTGSSDTGEIQLPKIWLVTPVECNSNTHTHHVVG